MATRLCDNFNNCNNIATDNGLCPHHHVFCGYDCDLLPVDCDKYHMYQHRQKAHQITRGDDIDHFRNMVYNKAVGELMLSISYPKLLNNIRVLNPLVSYSARQIYCRYRKISYYYNYPSRLNRQIYCIKTVATSFIICLVLLFLIYYLY